jgi:ubiquinone/menaquinone biosynthesis C-methylase UbiE
MPERNDEKIGTFGVNDLEVAKSYGEVLYKRATGESPEMESSKAAAKYIKEVLKENNHILDVGCGPGHYFRSLRNTISVPFNYFGADVNPLYVELAEKAFIDEKNVDFRVSDIYNLPFEENSVEIVMCCNVLLHLPSIRKPIEELCRVAKDFILLRTLIGSRSFRIMEVHAREKGDEFNDDGTPKSYNFYNIYSKDYILNIFSNVGISNVEFVDDKDFKPKNIEAAASEQAEANNVTRMIGNWQVNTYILQPWTFIKAFK